MILLDVPNFKSIQVKKVIIEKKGSESEMKITIIKQQETGKWCRPQHAVGTKPGQQSLPRYPTKNEFESQRTFHMCVCVCVCVYMQIHL